MSPFATRNQFLRNDPGWDSDQRALTATRLQQIADLREAFASHIIANGVFEGGDDVIPALLEVIGHEQLFADAIVELGDRLEAAGVDSTLPNPSVDDASARGGLEEAMLARCIEWGNAGYLLGLAVGMQLGPHAFDADGGR